MALSELTQAVLDDIPDEYLDRFQSLLHQPFRGAEGLRRALTQYDTTMRSVAPFVEFLDVEEAERLLFASHGLLQVAEASPAADIKQVVQAAILYFILEEEDEEVTGVLGLDDDAQILNAVARALALPQYIVQLKVHTLH